MLQGGPGLVPEVIAGVVLAARSLRPIRRQFAAMPLAALLPPTAVGVGQEVTWELDHLLNHVPDVAWVLIGALPLVRAIAAARRPAGQSPGWTSLSVGPRASARPSCSTWLWWTLALR